MKEMPSNKANYCCMDEFKAEVNSNQGYQYSSKKGYCVKSRKQMQESKSEMHKNS